MSEKSFKDSVADLVEEFEAAQEAAERTVTKLRAGENASSEPITDQPNKEETAAKPVKGEICKVTELYESQKSTCSCCTEWVEEKPFKEKTAEKKKAETKYDAFAINRRLQPHGTGRIQGGWKTHSLVIHSSRIQSSLEKVFEGYPVSYTTSRELVLRPPFTPFIHRWDKYMEVEQEESDAETKKHLQLLRETLGSELTGSFQRLNFVKETGVAEFQDLLFLFVPGDTLVQKIDIGMQAGLLRDVDLIKTERDTYLNLDVDVVDWNGTKFGFRTISWKLGQYGGTRQPSSLSIFPLHTHPDRQTLQESLVKRGRKLESLCGIHFKSYSGPIEGVGYGSPQWVSADKRISERIIIDSEGFYTLEGYYAPDMEPLEKPRLDTASPATVDVSTPPQATLSGFEENQTADRGPCGLTDDQCLLTCCFARGFALRSRKWCKFPVDNIQDIQFVPGVMQKLVIDKDEKDLIIAFLNNDSGSLAFDDFIPGKGKGIVMLLCGPPGVGKTLTAESVSEHLKRPLYKLGINDLGISISGVENNLKTALDRCSRWNAVLLIDEADVFLEKRSVNSLERNELVSIFLRLLEYYEGVMVLTTNRTTSIDPAFESRIDITLTFDGLTKEARKEIWCNFLEGLEPRPVINDHDIQELAEYPLNGRQIKSALKTATVLATSQRCPVMLRHLKVVLNLREKAMKLMEPTSGKLLDWPEKDSI